MLLSFFHCANGQVTKQASGPQELLASVGIDESVFEHLREADFNDPTTGDIAAIDHIATTLQRFDLADVDRWTKTIENNFADSGIGNLVLIDGLVQRIESTSTPAEGTVYRTVLRPKSPDLDGTISVWAKQIPDAWKPLLNRTVSMTARCQALLVKADSPTLVTARFAWLPDQSDQGPTADERLFAAARIGIDVSRFDEIEHGKKVSSADRESFYQILSHAEELDLLQSSGREPNSFNIVELLQKPRSQTGSVYQIDGIARRAIRIPVNDPDVRTRFGIDHYYEVDVFVLMNPTLILVDEQTGEKTSYHKFPMTFCVRELPPGFPQGPVITQAVSVHAMYFKLWAYRNELLSNPQVEGAEASKRRQQSPLFIAHAPTIRVVSNTMVRRWDSTAQAIGLVFAISVIIIAGILYRNSRRDASTHRKRNAGKNVTINIPE